MEALSNNDRCFLNLWVVDHQTKKGYKKDKNKEDDWTVTIEWFPSDFIVVLQCHCLWMPHYLSDMPMCELISMWITSHSLWQWDLRSMMVGESQTRQPVNHKTALQRRTKKKDSNWLTGRFSDVISEFDSLACVFDTVCIIIQDLKSVWFICRQLNFDSKCQVSCRYYIELNSEALQARPLHHCRSVTAVKLLS